MRLSILAYFVLEESIKKSESMIWSLKERFKYKKLLTLELHGYRRPRDAAGGYIKYRILEIEGLGTKYHIKEIAFYRWGAVQMVQNLEEMSSRSFR